jgi:hypothetical protein
MKAMSWMLRTSTAAVLSFVMFALPVALNQCASACDLHRSVTTASQPGCHHSTTPDSRLSPISKACGHDHGAVMALGATVRLAGANASPAWVLVVLAAGSRTLTAPQLVSCSRPLVVGTISGKSSLPLRI